MEAGICLGLDSLLINPEVLCLAHDTFDIEHRSQRLSNLQQRPLILIHELQKLQKLQLRQRILIQLLSK